jgi:hypothetical protein
MLIIGLAALLITTMTVSAVSDPVDDVLFWKGTNWQNWQWNIGDRPNIDIIDISYDAGNRLTITLTIDGSFNSDNSMYHIWYNTSDAYYYLHYSPYIETENEPVAVAFPINFENWTIEQLQNWVQPETEASINGNTMTGIFDWATEDHTVADFYAWAQEWQESGDQFTEFWVDYAPNDYSPYDEYEEQEEENGNGDGANGEGGDETTDKTNGTPGFEVIVVIAAISVIFIILRRRK